MSLEDDNTSNLPVAPPVGSNQHIKKAVQNSVMTKVGNSFKVSLNTIIKQQAAMFPNIDNLTNNLHSYA